MPKPVVLVVLEDNEVRTEILGGEPTVIVVDLDALLGDGSGAAEKLEELQNLPADTVEQWKLSDVEEKLRDIIDGDPEGLEDDEDDEEDFDDEEFDEDDFDDEDDDIEDFDDDDLGDEDEDSEKRWTPDEDRVIAGQASQQSDAEEFGPVS